jgi:hypothetical protein
MGFTCGIIGLPNVGKSTIFNALTSAKAASANFPFCTIEPNTGAVPVPDARLDILANLANSQKIIPTQMTFVDIAGLIRGASKGEGLGNQFLGHIRTVDAVAHVVRCFDDSNIIHVEGEVDPLRDIETINTELLLSDLDTVQKTIKKIEKDAKSGNKELKEQLEEAKKLEAHLSDFKAARVFSTTLTQLLEPLLTAKPTLLVANVAESEMLNEPNSAGIRLVDKVAAYAQKNGYSLVQISGQVEAEISELSSEERKQYLAALGIKYSGLDKLTLAGYKLLSLLTFFTVGPKETHAWSVKNGAKAAEAAGRIHTDFEKGFIRAEVIAYQDYVNYGSEAKCREAGKLRTEGKEYLVQDGDVMHFRFNN